MSYSECRRCLLDELTDGDYVRSVYEYIGALPADQRVSDEQYELRLETCKQCAHLVNGMCDLCGCFVEVRAAKNGSRCPDSRNRWEELL